MSRKQREKRARAKSGAQPPADKPVEHVESKRESKRASRSINRLGLAVAVVTFVGLFGVVLYLGDAPSTSTTTTSYAPGVPEEEPEGPPPVETWEASFQHKIPIDPARDYIRGPADARVTIVEFSDFECPFCKIAYEYVDSVAERYPDDVRLVYKNFPLDMACNADMAQQLHPYACMAAVMARCAGSRDPDLFWQFHDAIFEGDGFNDTWLNEKAAELGVGDDAFNTCVNSRQEFDEVRADIELGRALGVDSTPSFYINGREAPSYEIPALVAIVDHILASD